MTSLHALSPESDCGIGGASATLEGPGARPPSVAGAASTTSRWREEHALSHELRVRIVEAARGRTTVSAVELAAELEAPVSNVAYHVRRLCALRMLELDHETRVRGSRCRHYRLSSDGVSAGQRGALLGAVRAVARTAQAAAVEAPYVPLQATHRTVALDAQACAMLDAELRRVAQLLADLEAEASRRGGPAAPVTVALLIAQDAAGAAAAA